MPNLGIFLTGTVLYHAVGEATNAGINNFRNYVLPPLPPEKKEQKNAIQD
jgi:hypothetical protein